MGFATIAEEEEQSSHPMHTWRIVTWADLATAGEARWQATLESVNQKCGEITISRRKKRHSRTTSTLSKIPYVVIVRGVHVNEAFDELLDKLCSEHDVDPGDIEGMPLPDFEAGLTARWNTEIALQHVQSFQVSCRQNVALEDEPQQLALPQADEFEPDWGGSSSDEDKRHFCSNDHRSSRGLSVEHDWLRSLVTKIKRPLA